MSIEKTGSFKFVHHSHNEGKCCGTNNDFWLEDSGEVSEAVNKDPSFPKVPKARGNRTTAEYRALHNIARRLRPILRASLVNGINDFSKKIDLNDLAEAIEEADPQKALEVVPWDEFRDAVKGIEKVSLEGISESAEKSKFLFKRSIEQLIGVKPDITFDPNNPAISAWINDHLGELIQNIRENTQRGIQDVIREGLMAGRPPRQNAKLIKDMIGLNDRQITAVLNRRKKLQEQGVRGKRLDDMIKDYTKKQLKYRSELIARSEAMTANNRGQMEVAIQNADKGLFDRRKAKKKWIVTPYDRVCKVCRPMANKTVGLDENFKLRNGKSIPHPPAHPNCNCGWALILDEGDV